MRFALPTKKQVLKWSLGVFGAIVIGALGSGVWQSLLGPAIHSSARWVLDITSLGLTSYKNGVYEQIASENQAAVAVETLSWVTILSLMLMGFVIAYGFSMVDENRSKAQGLLQRLSKLSGEPESPEPDITVDTARQKLEAILKSEARQRLYLYIVSMVLGVIFVSQLIALSRLSYVSSADTHYHQVMRVVSPYLDAHEQAEVESEFALISSRGDYVRLLSRLEDQCKAHGRTVPKFEPW